MTGSDRDVMIIGAARSGTNMLRDVLTSLDGVRTWPCDEINYVWRHGNRDYPNDEIPADRATAAVQSYVQKSFRWVRRHDPQTMVVEKTCANSLRVPFVHRVLPEARLLYIHRDGIDAAVSARSRWTASLDLPYLLRKARFVPKGDLPYYASRYLRSRLDRRHTAERRVGSWGPRTRELDRWLAEEDLLTVCALQWQECVSTAEAALREIDAGQVLRVSYEALVRAPDLELRRIVDWLEIGATHEQVTVAGAAIRTTSVGRARASLSAAELEQLQHVLGSTLERDVE
jgi:hypothetical protein